MPDSACRHHACRPLSVIGAFLGRVSSHEPRVPEVDLLRVDAAQFQIYDHTVGSFLVTDDNAMANWIDVFAAGPPAPVAADIETRGLDVQKFSITAVTVSFHLGADTVALLFDPLRRDNHRRLLAKVFDHASQIVFHGASFDVAPLYAHHLMTRAHIRKLGDTMVAARMVNTNAKAGRSLEELATAYNAMNDDRTTMDSVFAARGLRKDQGYWFTDIDCPTYVVGALSDTVATLRLWGTPGVGGEGIMATAARYLTSPDRGMGGSGVLEPAAAEQVVEDVQQVNRIILERTARGYRVDEEFPERFLAETAADTAAAAHTLAAAGIRPGNGLDLVTALVRRGEINAELWPRTKTGQLQADKKALEVFDNPDSSIHSELVTAHQQVARSEKVLGYVTKVVENAGPTGRLHPEIKVLGASATGRMCLPESEMLLTRRGFVAVDDIRIGDRTIDASGLWTTVRAVHRYSSAPIHGYLLDDGTHLTCTPEHRWVVRNGAGGLELLPLDRSESADRVRLTPPRARLRSIGTALIDPVAEREVGRIGVAVMAESAHAGCARREAIDKVAAIGTFDAGAHAALREVRDLRQIRTARTRQWFRHRGVTPNYPLTWALGAPIPDLWMLLRGAGFIDGNRISSSEHVFDDVWAAAFAVALYRLGVRTRVIQGRVSVCGVQEPAPVARSREESGDVWCVTTDSGTFTAWGAKGPYLTGNSASKPEIQQFPDAARGVILADDEDWISVDWKSIEPVVLATASGDQQFIADMRAGEDPYEPVGRLAGVDRKLAKRKMLADMYGQGHKAAALQYGWSLQRAKEVAFRIRDGLPILYMLIDALKEQSQDNGYVTTLTGRVLDQRFSFFDNGIRMNDIAERIAPNHFCQGSALDVMHYSILELDRLGLSDHVHLWMHDEIVADACIADELVKVMGTPPPFVDAVARYHGMEAFLGVDLNHVGQRWKSV